MEQHDSFEKLSNEQTGGSTKTSDDFQRLLWLTRMNCPTAHRRKFVPEKLPKFDRQVFIENLVASDFNIAFLISSLEYLPDWKVLEALRELIVNAIDQAKEVSKKYLGDKAVVVHRVIKGLAICAGEHLLAEVKWSVGKLPYISNYEVTGVIKARMVAVPAQRCDVDEDLLNSDDEREPERLRMEIINYSSYLPRRSFHIGISSKRGNKSVIGKHGEGLSAACVVLMRAGCNVVVDTRLYKAEITSNNGEVYYQLCRRHAKKDKVHFKLTFDTPNKVDIDQMVDAVLLPANVARVKTTNGDLLTPALFAGKQYNRDVFVTEAKKGGCLFGYNFADQSKRLLQGRDRNVHDHEPCLREIGAILSEALMKDDAVCNKILDALVCKQDPGAEGTSCLPEYKDLMEGKYLSEEAIDYLQQAHKRRLHSKRTPIYCAVDTTVLKQISKCTGRPIVYCHRVLHNHAEMTELFFHKLTKSITSLPKDSPIYDARHRLAKMLDVDDIFVSRMESAKKMMGLWTYEDCCYITGMEHYDAARAAAAPMSKEQLHYIHETLQCCGIELLVSIGVVDELRGDLPLDALLRQRGVTVAQVKAVLAALQKEKERGSVTDNTEVAAEGDDATNSNTAEHPATVDAPSALGRKARTEDNANADHEGVICSDGLPAAKHPRNSPLSPESQFADFREANTSGEFSEAEWDSEEDTDLLHRRERAAASANCRIDFSISNDDSDFEIVPPPSRQPHQPAGGSSGSSGAKSRTSAGNQPAHTSAAAAPARDKRAPAAAESGAIVGSSGHAKKPHDEIGASVATASSTAGTVPTQTSLQAPAAECSVINEPASAAPVPAIAPSPRLGREAAAEEGAAAVAAQSADEQSVAVPAAAAIAAQGVFLSPAAQPFINATVYAALDTTGIRLDSIQDACLALPDGAARVEYMRQQRDLLVIVAGEEPPAVLMAAYRLSPRMTQILLSYRAP